MGSKTADINPSQNKRERSQQGELGLVLPAAASQLLEAPGFKNSSVAGRCQAYLRPEDLPDCSRLLGTVTIRSSLSKEK